MSATDRTARRRPRDEGSVLVLTLLLVVVLGAVGVSLATFATAGVRASRVTTELTERNAAASSGVTWAVEEFAKKRLTPDDCDASPASLQPPAGLVDGVDLACTATVTSELGNPQVLLEATAASDSGGVQVIEVLLEVPAQRYTAQVNRWTAD